MEGTEAEGSFASNKARILFAIPEGLKPEVYQVQGGGERPQIFQIHMKSRRRGKHRFSLISRRRDLPLKWKIISIIPPRNLISRQS